MIFVFKYVSFVIYAFLITVFASYLRLANFIDEYIVNRYQNVVEDSSTYDYVIVGGGSAGSVLAARLSEAGESVLIIEAGGRPPPFIDIPVLSPLLQRSVYDWNYKTVPQKYSCKGLVDNQSLWPMGKILGGSSRLNYMAWVRGHKEDFVDWFEDFNEYSMNNVYSSIIDYPKWSTDFSDGILKGAKEIGQSLGNINEDLNIGFDKVQLTSKNGERFSADRFLIRENKNLNIVTHALVTKILFDGKRASGVGFEKLGTPMKIFAKKKVVLCAGAIGSPKLLMLSGIGPKNHLRDLKIDLVADLPVGQNLMDHILTGIDLVVLNASLELNLINLLNPLSAFDYFVNGGGPWTSSGIEVVGTLYSNSSKNLKSSGPPDLQIMVMPIGISQDGGFGLKKLMGIDDEIFRKYYSPLTDKTAVSILPVLLHPKSKGEIKLSSNNPKDQPIIDPKYLSVKEDVDVLIDGIKFVKKLLKTESMKKFDAKIYHQIYPMCDKYLFDSYNYWECYVRHVTMTSYHPAGTCQIGKVVDKSFRVYNTDNLYVVDSSVLPLLPSGNINAAVIMSAEKAAKLFLNKQKKNKIKMINYHQNCNFKNDFIQYLFNF